jgi:2-polyprenyl-3-methyl-5-hydroxy-6-metoxy-1,4-benzoquinol methylase
LDLHTYEILYDTEATHWWHTARRNIVLDWIRQRYPNRSDLHVLDAGCGTGLMLQELRALGTAEGVDISDEALQFCRLRGLDNVRKADVTDMPFGPGEFDVVTALDVLEHVDDDGVDSAGSQADRPRPR